MVDDQNFDQKICIDAVDVDQSEEKIH